MAPGAGLQYQCIQKIKKQFINTLIQRRIYQQNKIAEIILVYFFITVIIFQHIFLMAETFSKKEREKKKRQIRLEKEQRKQERKEQSRNGNNMDEMMAYLDVEGNLTNLPPDQQPRHQRKPDNSNNSKNDGSFRTGTIKFIDYKKGFGFIKDSVTQESIFVQTNVLPATVNKTGKVKFKTRQDSRGLSAIFVENIG